MIDVYIELRQVLGGWEQVGCVVELHGDHIPVLEIPAREDEIFPTKPIAIATLKERVAFELQQNHVHASVQWHIKTH
jgi:hypothetical protein